MKIIDDRDRELELLNPEYKSPIPTNLQWRNWAADPEGITGGELLDFINAALFPMLKDLAVTGFMVEAIDPSPGKVLLDPACGTGGFLTCSIRHMRDRYVKRVEDERAMQSALKAVEKKQLPHMLCVTNMLLHGIEDPSFVGHDNTLARPYISYGASERVDIILTNPPFGGREEDGIESNFPKQFQTKETADLFLALMSDCSNRGVGRRWYCPMVRCLGKG